MEAADKDFNALAKKQMKLTVSGPLTVGVMQENFGPLGNQRSIVRWAFDGDSKNRFSKRFEIANVGHVIAEESIDDSGLVPVYKLVDSWILTKESRID
jgi:peptidyl-prolyl cis-trans isomerase D